MSERKTTTSGPQTPPKTTDPLGTVEAEAEEFRRLMASLEKRHREVFKPRIRELQRSGRLK